MLNEDEATENLESPAFLSERQKLFVIELVQNGGDVEKAARYAGFVGTGAQLRSIGRGLLSWPHVMKYKIEKERMHQARLDVTEDRIINELSLIAFADPIDFCDSEGRFLPLHKLPERIRRAISSIGLGEYNLLAKEKALDKLCKIRGMFKDDAKANVNVSLTTLTKEDVEERIKAIMGDEGYVEPMPRTNTPTK